MIRISIQRADRTDTPREERRRKRGTVLKLALGGLALVGIGTGLTAAAWSDDANFKASTSSAKVALKAWNANVAGCAATPPTTLDTSNSCWLDADDSTGAVTITDPGFVLTNLVPTASDRTISTTLYLANAGSTSVNVSATCVGTGSLFDNPVSASVGTGHPLTVSLSASKTACSSWTSTVASNTQSSVVLNVVVPGYWYTSNTYKNGSGSLPVVFTGTAS